MSAALEGFVGRLSQDELRSPRLWGGLLQRFAERHNVRYGNVRDEFTALAAVEVSRRERLASDAGELRGDGRWSPHFDIAIRA